MTNAEKFLKELEKRRPKVLDAKARAYAATLVKDKIQAKAFLQDIGFLDKNGKLAAPYR